MLIHVVKEILTNLYPKIYKYNIYKLKINCEIRSLSRTNTHENKKESIDSQTLIKNVNNRYNP